LPGISALLNGFGSTPEAQHYLEIQKDLPEARLEHEIAVIKSA
jgi:hypothetical protein